MTTDKEKLLAFADSLDKLESESHAPYDAAAVIRGFIKAYEAIERDYDYSVQQDDENLGLERALTYIETTMKKAAEKIGETQ